MLNYIRKFQVLFICLLTLALTSCETTRDDRDEHIGDINGDDDYKEYLEVVRKSYKDPSFGKVEPDSVDSLDYKKEIKKDQVTSLKGDKPINVKEPFYKQDLANDTTKVEVIADFDNTPLSEVIPAFAGVLGFNYMIDPAVKGTTTLSINTEMPKKEVWSLFEKILRFSGAYCSMEGNVVHIMPFENMAKEKNLLSAGADRANVEAVMFRLKNASSKVVVEQIKPFLTEGATLTESGGQNSVLVIETPANIPKLKAIVDLLDQPKGASWSRVVVACSNVPADMIKLELERVMPVLGFPVSEDKTPDDTGAIHLVTMPRFELIVASAANAEALKELEAWVKTLDKRDEGNQERVFVYKVNNGRAEELVQVLSVIFAVDGKSQTAKTYVETSDDTSELSSGATQDSEEPKTSIFDVPSKIYADGVNNRLVIRTTTRTYAMMKALLNRLDTPVTQVLLQVMIASIDLTDDREFGVQFSNENVPGNPNKSFFTSFADLDQDGLVYDYSADPAAVSGAVEQYGANYSFKVNDQFVYLRALAGKTEFRVLSSPQVSVLNHKQAKVEVGRDVSVQTGSVSEGAASSKTFEYKETGIRMHITPHITSNGLITLDLHQEISDVGEKTIIGNPDILKKTIDTTMTIRDGKTLVVGGLIYNKSTSSEENLPFLQNLGIISKLFGYTDAGTQREELLIMVTGKIIDEKSKLQSMTRRYREAVEELRKLEKELE